MSDDIEAPAGDVAADEPLDDPGTPPEETPEETPSNPAADEDDEPESYRNFKKKYPNADEKTLRHLATEKYWEQTKELSRLARENEELRKSKAAPAAETKPEPEAPDPDLQELDQELQRLDSEAKELAQDTVKGLTDLSEINSQIKRLEGQLEVVGDHEKEAIQSRIEVKQAQYRAVYAEWKANKKSLADTQRLMVSTRRDRMWAENLNKESKARQKKEEQSVREAVAAVPGEVERFTKASMEQLKFPLDPQLREDLMETVRESVTVYFGRHSDTPLSEIDLPGLIENRVQRYMKAKQIVSRQSFRDESQRRAAASGQRPQATPTPGKPAPAGGLSRYQLAKRNMAARFAPGRR